MPRVKIFPAEGFGAHIRSVDQLSDQVVGFEDSIDNLEDLMRIRAIWNSGGSPPANQFCVTNNVPQVIELSENTLVDPRITVDTIANTFTFNANMLGSFSVQAHIIREIGGGTAAQWAMGLEVFTGTWNSVANAGISTTFDKDAVDEVFHVTFSVLTDFVPAGAMFRFVQVTDDVTKNIGITSRQPFAAVSEAAGFIVSIQGREVIT